MQFADRWGMEGVPDDKEGALYDPYDEQRLLELENGDDVTMLTIPEDSLLNSSADEDVVPVDPNTGKDVAPEPVARPDDTQTAPAQPPTGTDTREAVAAGPADKPPTTRSDDSAAKPKTQPTGSQTRAGSVHRSSAGIQSNVGGSSASTTNSAQLPSEYLANKHCTRIRNGAPSIHDGSDVFRVENGSFFNEGDNRYEQCWMVYDNASKCNISYSFNPDTMLCTCCKDVGNVKKKRPMF